MNETNKKAPKLPNKMKQKPKQNKQTQMKQNHTDTIPQTKQKQGTKVTQNHSPSPWKNFTKAEKCLAS